MYPDNIINPTQVTAGTSTVVDDHAGRHNKITDLLVALQTKVGIDGDTTPSTHEAKINSLLASSLSSSDFNNLFNVRLALKSTSDLSEGANKYYTFTRFNTDFSSKTTDNLTQGSTNKYYSSTLFDNDLSTKTTDDLDEGLVNKYFSQVLVSANTDVIESKNHITEYDNPHQVTMKQVSPTTSKGDLIVHTSTGANRIPVGYDNQLLVSDSTADEGVRWKSLPDVCVEEVIDILQQGFDMEGGDISNVGNISTDTIQLNTNYIPTGIEPVGTSYWDSANNTFSDVLEDGVTGQRYEEDFISGQNDTGVTLLNGTVATYAGSIGNSGNIRVENTVAASTEAPMYNVGIITHDILNGATGKITTRGKVRGIQTNGANYGETWTAGDILYKSSTISGGLTKVPPQAPIPAIPLCLVISAHATNGTLLVRPTFPTSLEMLTNVNGTTPLDKYLLKYNATSGYWDAAINPTEITQDPTGFKSPESVIITGNGDRTVTLTGTVEPFWKSDPVTSITSGWISPTHGTDTSKTYYLYYNGTTTAWYDSVWTFDKLQICIAKYDTVNAQWRYMRECHGLMSWTTHRELHETIGTYKSAGGTIPSASYVLSSTTAANRRPNIDQTVISDEDLQSTLLALTSKTYTTFELGTAAADTFTLGYGDIVQLSTNNPYYNTFSTPNWSRTLMPANSVATIWIYATPATADTISQAYRYIFVQPQWITLAAGSSAAQITTAVNSELLRTPSELNLGTLSTAEIIAIGRVTIAYTGGNWTLRNVSLLSGNKYSQIGSPAGNFLSTVATDATLTGNGTVGSPISVIQNYISKGVAGEINAITDKATIADNDVFLIEDSADTYNKKKNLFSVIKANLKSYLDGVTTTLTNKTLTSPVINNTSAQAINTPILYVPEGLMYSAGTGLVSTVGGNGKADLSVINPSSGARFAHRIDSNNEYSLDYFNGVSWKRVAKATSTDNYIIPLNAPQGFLINGKIVRTVASGNMTVAIKTLAGTDPSATDPVYCRIGNTVRSITSALSVSANAATNWLNMGSNELATKEVDLFTYLGWQNDTSSVRILFARTPNKRLVTEFNVSANNENGSINNYTAYGATDEVELIGRFNATLSAGAGYTWSIPATDIIINRPIFETRWLDWIPVYTGFSTNPSSTGIRYKISGNILYYYKDLSGSTGVSNATTKTISLPFSCAASASSSAHLNNILLADNGSFQATSGYCEIYGNVAYCYKSFYQGAWTNSGNCNIYIQEQHYQI